MDIYGQMKKYKERLADMPKPIPLSQSKNIKMDLRGLMKYARENKISVIDLREKEAMAFIKESSMGGQVLELQSERLWQGARTQELCSCVQDGDMTPERAAKRLKMTVPELHRKMEEKGYKFPENQ